MIFIDLEKESVYDRVPNGLALVVIEKERNTGACRHNKAMYQDTQTRVKTRCDTK